LGIIEETYRAARAVTPVELADAKGQDSERLRGDRLCFLFLSFGAIAVKSCVPTSHTDQPDPKPKTKRDTAKPPQPSLTPRSLLARGKTVIVAGAPK